MELPSENLNCLTTLTLRAFFIRITYLILLHISQLKINLTTADANIEDITKNAKSSVKRQAITLETI
jgi:hypothetical protein